MKKSELLLYRDANIVTGRRYKSNRAFWEWMKRENVPIYGTTYRAVKYGDLLDAGLIADKDQM